MSIQCHEDIQYCITRFWQLCKRLLHERTIIHTGFTSGLINSDILENIKSTYGANENPFALQYRQTLNSTVLGKNQYVYHRKKIYVHIAL